jgi:hypothetical protein
MRAAEGAGEGILPLPHHDHVDVMSRDCGGDPRREVRSPNQTRLFRSAQGGQRGTRQG